MRNLLLSTVAFLAMNATSAFAADYVTPDTTEVAVVNNADLIIELGAGISAQPAYEGAQDYIVSGYPIVSLQYLSIPGLFDIGSREEKYGGFSLAPAFRYVDSRNASKYPELYGTLPLDETYELGLRAGYEFALTDVYGVEVYGTAMYAFGEVDAFVGDAGIDFIARPSEQWTMKLGPRTSFASQEYMDTYFSISVPESVQSGGRLGVFEADGGFKTVGVAGSARYEFRPNWFLNADAAYERLVGDAADSPIAEVGSKDQFFVGLGLSRKFSIDLF